jgi:cytochrome c biogenesis factor
MTSVHIIIGLILLTCGAIGFIFIKQTIAQRKRDRERLLNALNKRAKELVQMLNVFPAYFLPKVISVFLYRCIVDVFEQLSKLEPGRPEFLEQFMLYTATMETTIRQPDNAKQANLQSTTQINEIRQYLNYLSRFMQKWVERGNLSSKQFAAYKVILRSLSTKLMIDNYILSATKSVDIGKAKLAVHYLTLAKDIIVKEGLGNTQADNIAHISEELVRLNKLLKLENEAMGNTPVERVPITEVKEEEWDAFEGKDHWKKRDVYD